MLMIRLSRVGKKKHPTFRLIVSEKSKDTHGDFLELLGTYDPHTSPATVTLKVDRIKHWISNGAQPSGVVHNILIDHDVIKGEKIRVANIRKKKESKEGEEASEGKTPSTEKKEEVKKEEPKKEGPSASSPRPAIALKGSGPEREVSGPKAGADEKKEEKPPENKEPAEKKAEEKPQDDKKTPEKQ
ncbi:30S ribosomal protein S16 [Patescibacteria group bacterium]